MASTVIGQATDISSGQLTQQPMGIGVLGDSSLVFKRKFRWTFGVEFPGNGCGLTAVPENFVKVAARPNLAIEETEINFLNAKTWIPGKASWETITVTYIDVAGTPTSGGKAGVELYTWLATVYDFASANAPVTNYQGSRRSDYEGTGILSLYDGCGTEIERWQLNHMWPTGINFGDLDYSSSDTAEVELTLRYSSVQYKNFCPGYNITGCCTACS